MLYLLALRLALANKTVSEEQVRRICTMMLKDIPAVIQKTLQLSPRIYEIASRLVAAEHIFYIGRDIDWALCTEG